ncbi:uncharacterized protein LOC143909670 [Arctopsyche grandis]|uniref:uncharacterized protein LOC143909670 n=1 Tax=Arctopsyche grandis TaxID=121162 RepID=UPI00406D6537
MPGSAEEGSLGDGAPEKGAVPHDPGLRNAVVQQLELIATGVSDEEFFEWLKLRGANVNWVRMFDLIKKQLSIDLVEEWNDMWETENLTEKINTLNQLKEKYKNETKQAWRPETGNIKPQITNLDVQYLTRLKNHYSKLVTEKEDKLNKLKEELTDEWDQLRTYQNQIREAQKRNSLMCKSIDKSLKENINTISKAYSKS